MENVPDQGPTLNAATRTELIARTLETLKERYVFPDVALAMEASVSGRQARGEYDSITTGEELCEVLTRHLQEGSRDKHLKLRYHREVQPPREGDIWDDPEVIAEYLAEAAFDNYGVHKVERLSGNVGYLQLTSIFRAESAARTVAAAMAVLARTSALIIDVRRNRGGAPTGVAFLCSYFFSPEPVHLNDMYRREGGVTEQSWTLPHLPGERYLDKPVYLLTSDKTFSGAEELAYDLQQLRRACVVGETTAGGAHPVEVYQLDPHFDLRVPTGRPINPVTATNWEGTGVAPDIAVSAERALSVAHATALQAIIAGVGEVLAGPEATQLEEARAALAVLGDVSSQTC